MEYEFLCKTFRCCIEEDCDSCPLYDFEIEHCEKQIKLQALSFIILQQAEIEEQDKAILNALKRMGEVRTEAVKKAENEIEQWKEEANKYQNMWCATTEDIQMAKDEAVREFAEKYKTEVTNRYEDIAYKDLFFGVIDNLVREMTEKEGGKG